MKRLKKKFESVRVKLFIYISIVILSIIFLLILLNNVVLEEFYLYNKQNSLKLAYSQINEQYKESYIDENFEEKLEKIAINNSFDILIKNNENISIYTSNRDFFSTIGKINEMENQVNSRNDELLQFNKDYSIKKVKDTKNGITYILLSARLDNGYLLYIRMPITSIQESVRISNKFLYLIGSFSLLIGGIIVLYISKRFTEPILELNDIAKRMSNLDFSQKYESTTAEDEIDDLGKSINAMSHKLESTIKQLRSTNFELEKDIEEKSKIDEMRKSFISDVSHELKTPISLIQGYSEGLLENVNTDEESRKFYAEVILDEINKMDKLVKQLLELMKLEYGKREFDNKQFNIVELEKEVLRSQRVKLEEKNIIVEFSTNGDIQVFADDFYIDQVITNYITNAIKNVKEINGKKIIKIKNDIYEKNNKVRISVINTGDRIDDEDKTRIWNRFYKLDESRNRDDGGTGIGLSIVKAIMTNYNNNYGVENIDDGVQFYFDLDLA